MTNTHTIVHNSIQLKLCVTKPTVPGHGFQVTAQRHDGAILRPFGYQKTHQIGSIIVQAFDEQDVGVGAHFMDGIEIDARFRGQGFAKYLIHSTVETFESVGGIHLAGLNANEVKLAQHYVRCGYRSLEPQRPIGTDSVNMIQQWLVRDYGPLWKRNT